MVGFLVAIVATSTVVAALVLGRRHSASPALDRASSWVSSTSGSLGLLALAVPMITSWLGWDDVGEVGASVAWLFPASITLGLVGLATGIVAISHRERSWRSWIGLVAGGLVTSFWVAFAIGEVLYPH